MLHLHNALQELYGSEDFGDEETRDGSGKDGLLGGGVFAVGRAANPIVKAQTAPIPSEANSVLHARPKGGSRDATVEPLEPLLPKQFHGTVDITIVDAGLRDLNANLDGVKRVLKEFSDYAGTSSRN